MTDVAIKPLTSDNPQTPISHTANSPKCDSGSVKTPANLPKPSSAVRNDGQNIIKPHNRKSAFTLAEGATHVDIFAKKRQVAFTLAEVLITLGVIGIVAAMTLPALVARQQEKAIVASLKKAYNILNNAYLSASYEYGTPEDWDLVGNFNAVGAKNLADKFIPFLNTLKVCEPSKGKDCIPKGGYSYHFNKNAGLNHSNAAAPVARIVLKDGMVLILASVSPDCSEWGFICGIIDVDVNGFKKPNEMGYDVFSFYVTKEGVIPRGGPLAKVPLTFRNNCGNHFQGTSCAGWVIYNENMEYLRCNDLDWGVKTKCK